jgi:osmotically-inducible protein OsmY
MAGTRRKAAKPIDPVDVAANVTGGVVMLDGLVDEQNARVVLEQVALDVAHAGGAESDHDD